MITIRGYTLKQLAVLEDVCYLTVWKRRHDYFPVVIETGIKNKRKIIRYLNRELSALMFQLLNNADEKKSEDMKNGLATAIAITTAFADTASENAFVEIPDSELEGQIGFYPKS
jgi:hypothetical protein